MDCSTRKGEKMKGAKNRGKKLVVVKLIFKKKLYNNNKKSGVFCKSSEFIPLASNPGIVTWYSGLCGEG
jgi:hypothetical protein